MTSTKTGRAMSWMSSESLTRFWEAPVFSRNVPKTWQFRKSCGIESKNRGETAGHRGAWHQGLRALVICSVLTSSGHAMRSVAEWEQLFVAAWPSDDAYYRPKSL